VKYIYGIYPHTGSVTNHMSILWCDTCH